MTAFKGIALSCFTENAANDCVFNELICFGFSADTCFDVSTATSLGVSVATTPGLNFEIDDGDNSATFTAD